MGLTKTGERREELKAAAEELENQCFRSQIRRLMEEYIKRDSRLEVIGAFKNLFQAWPKQREAGSLGICYRLADVLMRRHRYELILYGEEFYLDEEAIKENFELPHFHEMFEADTAFVMSGLKKEYHRIKAYEEDAVRGRIAEYYHGAVFALSRDIVWELIETDEFKRLKKKEDFFIFFGHYQGEGEIIYPLGRETDGETKVLCPD